MGPRGLEFFLSDALFLGMPVFSRVLFFRNHCFSEIGVFGEIGCFQKSPYAIPGLRKGVGADYGRFEAAIFQRLLSLFDLTSHHC